MSSGVKLNRYRLSCSIGSTVYCSADGTPLGRLDLLGLVHAVPEGQGGGGDARVAVLTSSAASFCFCSGGELRDPNPTALARRGLLYPVGGYCFSPLRMEILTSVAILPWAKDRTAPW